MTAQILSCGLPLRNDCNCSTASNCRNCDGIRSQQRSCKGLAKPGPWAPELILSAGSRRTPLGTLQNPIFTDQKKLHICNCSNVVRKIVVCCCFFLKKMVGWKSSQPAIIGNQHRKAICFLRMLRCICRIVAPVRYAAEGRRPASIPRTAFIHHS